MVCFIWGLNIKTYIFHFYILIIIDLYMWHQFWNCCRLVIPYAYLSYRLFYLPLHYYFGLFSVGLTRLDGLGKCHHTQISSHDSLIALLLLILCCFSFRIFLYYVIVTCLSWLVSVGKSKCHTPHSDHDKCIWEENKIMRKK